MRQARNAIAARIMIDQISFFGVVLPIIGFSTIPLLKTDYLVTRFNQFIEINLFSTAMISILHNVEVKKLASSLKYPIGKSKEFSLIQNGIFL
jgi:hypothetical protein